MVRSTINMFVAFGSAGLGLTATKYISEYRFSNKAKVYSIYCLSSGFAIVTGVIVSLIVLLFADYLATNTLSAPHLANSIRIGAFLLLVTVINGAQNGTLLGFEAFRSIAFNNLYGSIAESVGMLLGAYYWGVSGAVLGFGLGYLVLYFANRVSIRKEFGNIGIIKKGLQIQKEDYSLLYKFSIPASLAGIMIGPVYWVIRTMLVKFNGYSDLAIYEASDYWKSIILFIPTSLSQIILPILSSVVNLDTNKFWRVFKVNLGINVVIACLLAICISLASPWIMRSYGDSYSGNTLPLILLSFSTVFSTASSVVGLSITSRAKMWTGFLFNFIWALILISCSYFFLKMNLGASGLALAILISYLIHTIYQFIYLKHISK